jgi:PAS domain S-box-containing protein
MGESWESWFWTVFAASHNAMAIVDADRVVVSANEALQRLLGGPGEELAGRPIDEALPASDRGAIGDRWRATLTRGESHGIQEIVTRDGSAELGFAAHVAHVGGRLVVLVILSPGREGDLGAAAGDAPPAPLTPRELEIVGRLALGATSRDIADELHVTPETVRTHVRNAMGKTRTSTRAHLVAAAICRGFLPAISPK